MTVMSLETSFILYSFKTTTCWYLLTFSLFSKAAVDLAMVPRVPCFFCRHLDDQPGPWHCVFLRNVSDLILIKSVSVSYSWFLS